jgi:predicted branched-subunit amino acid permease
MSALDATPAAAQHGAMMQGFRAAMGAPAIAMAATFLGFGAAVAAAGLGLGWALAAALLVYGMPGQLILLGAVSGGDALGAAVLSAIAANARFLPMAVALSPWLGGGGARWLALPFIAVTPWAGGMRALPGVAVPRRLAWFLGFALACWAIAAAATVLGFWAAPSLPAWLLALLVFTNPLYFGLVLAAERRLPAARRAMIGGALASPLVLVLPSAWGLLAAGVVGGSIAFWIGEYGRR